MATNKRDFVLVPAEGNEVAQYDFEPGKTFYPKQLEVSGGNCQVTLRVPLVPEYRGKADAAETHGTITIRGEEVVETVKAMLRLGSTFISDAELVQLLTEFRATAVKVRDELAAREARKKARQN